MEVVRLRGLASSPHLNGELAQLQLWDEKRREWLVEVLSSYEQILVCPANLEREVDADAGAGTQLSTQLEELRSVEFETVYDHPQLLGYIWGKAKVGMPEGSEQAQLGGVPCAVFGRQPASPRGTPTVLIFKGNSDFPTVPLEYIARAYVDSLGAQVVVPFCSPKLSECLASARAVVAALPRAFGPGPLLVQGMNTGSILAIQVAAEQSHPGMLPRVWLLVLDNAPPALMWIPGAQGMLGCMSGDPLLVQNRIRLVHCHTVLVRGFEGDLPKAAGPTEPMDILARCCGASTTTVHAVSTLSEGGGFQTEIDTAASEAMACAEAASERWIVDVPCLVREGAGLKSPEVGRLQSGATLKLMEQQGLRLRVQKLAGEGPNEGWVSFVVSGKLTLRPGQ